jgi:hypothetical protein
MTNDGHEDIARVSEQIISLIFHGAHAQARYQIESAKAILSTEEAHRLLSLSAIIEREAGDIEDGIKLMRQAVEIFPTWLPHLYRISVYLMDAQRWADALPMLDELILLSERNNDVYFIDESRLRKIMCLTKLGRRELIPNEKAKISPGVSAFIGSDIYRADDFE